MKYVNKEYGFAFRPPFYEKFYSESEEGSEITRDNFPDKFVQGVGYDPCAINGTMIVGKNGSVWGIRVTYYDGKKWLDGNDFIKQNLQAGANTADGSYAHFSCGDLSIRWAKITENGVAFIISSRKKLKVRVICYPFFHSGGELSIEGNQIKGRAPHTAIIKGSVALDEHNAIFKQRYLVFDESQREYFMLKSFNNPSNFANGAFNEAITEFVMGKNQTEVCMYAYVGDESIYEKSFTRERIINHINTAELRYGVQRFSGAGTLGGGAEQLYNSVLWSRIYYPYLMLPIFSPRRGAINEHFDIKGLDENCGAILGCLIDPQQALTQAQYTVEDKILGAITAWYAVCNLETIDGLRELMQKIIAVTHERPHLVVSDSEKNEVAYKWRDSPLKENYRPIPMYSLDMSCLKLLSYDIIIKMARRLDDNAVIDKFSALYGELKEKINSMLYCSAVGLYMNRYVTGEWATSVGGTSFYPLICGAVDSDKVDRLIGCLTDPKLFWGECVVPTLSRNHKEFGKKSKPDNNGKRNPPFFKYRGSIIPYVNFLIYYGLVRYDFDKIASEIARKSAMMWQRNENTGILNYEYYLPTGKVKKTSPSSMGNIMQYIAVRELLDLEYDACEESLRFGTFVAGENALNNVKLCSHVYSVLSDDNHTLLIMDGINVFRGDGGKFKVRRFTLTDSGASFEIISSNNITVNLNVQNPDTKKLTRYYFITKAGRCKVEAKNGLVKFL